MMWNIINSKVTRKAEKSNLLPHSLIMDNKEVSIVKTAEAFNNHFWNMADDLQIQIDIHTKSTIIVLYIFTLRFVTVRNRISILFYKELFIYIC
jgi:hypothetical protein